MGGGTHSPSLRPFSLLLVARPTLLFGLVAVLGIYPEWASVCVVYAVHTSARILLHGLPYDLV